MTPSSEEKEIRARLHSFPALQMEEEKRQEIARHIRQESERLARLKRRSMKRKVIAGIVASFAFLLVTFQVIPPTLPLSMPSLNKEENQNTNAVVTKEESATVSTIDRQIQAYVDEALDKTEAAYHPENMTVIVADPHTGEILGMGNRGKQDAADRLNAVRAIPNPTAAFRMVTLAAAIEEGKFDPKELYESGIYKKIPGRAYHDHNNGRGWGKITFLEGVQRSSNVLFAILGNERLKQDLLQEYLVRFGFGKKTGIEFSHEESGEIPKMNSLRGVAMAAMGQGGSASAIQQAAAIGVIANGGKLMKPHMFRKADLDTNHHYMVRQVVSERTAKQVREILKSIVNIDTGADKAFAMQEYPVAGISSVTQKYDQQGKVMEGKYIVSFTGFAPSDHPRLLVHIAVDDPKTETPVVLRGREIAPLFKEVMKNSWQYLEKQ